ncbi:MAG: transglycosylase domain-containing protein [Deltaproteobacteria bacterium]|nr:transglycosylase domain-containing protein [Deltaproteobacteria bacterium]
MNRAEVIERLRRYRPILWRWFKRSLVATTAILIAFVAVTAVAVFGWSYDLENLEAGDPIVLTDRHGRVLRTVSAAHGLPRREAWVELDELPAIAIATVVHSEDERFFDHPGVDWRGIARAAALNIKERRLGYGGSTITMQLVRMIHHPNPARTFRKKIVEAVLALRLERALGKRAILEHYLNRAYYGNGAYGLEAAARTYFGKSAAALSDGEATFLVVIPRAPTAYDPVVDPAAAIRRRDYLLELLVERGAITADSASRARAQHLAIAVHRQPFEAPHFTEWVLQELPAELHRGGVIRTTLDLELQKELEHRVTSHVDSLASKGLGQAGAIVLDTQTGEVLAAVGSAGWDRRDGQLNILTRKRHPGSALKPFVYALAIEAGDNPATIALDIHEVPSSYRTQMVTQPERGPVRYREALAGSYNLAAIHVLEKIGIERLISLLRRAGVGELEQGADDYGLRLALGAAKVRLANLASAYGALVRGGTMVLPKLLLSATTESGAWTAAPPVPRRLLSPHAAWLVMDMLSDPQARKPAFGPELAVDLPYPIAVKTGTSRGFADTVTVGVTNELTVAAWAGNFDGEPTQGLVAMEAAAPLVRDGFILASRGRHPTLPEPPVEIVSAEVCPLSGKRPGPACPHRKHEHFHRDHVPTDSCQWHRRDPEGRIRIDWPAVVEPWARSMGRVARN